MGKTRETKTVSDNIVCEIHKFSGYAVLSNCFVRSTKLGCPAIGLLGRVMDLPPTWNFSKAGLIALCPDGETAIDSALKNLKECGYLEIEVKMPNENPTGRIHTVYKFYEYSAKYTSIPQYNYELETFTVDNAVLNLVKKVGNFTMISSKLLRNKEIPNKLLGFLLKVLSLPDYWHFSMSGLKAICKEGKTAVHIGLPDCSMPEFILFSAWLKFDIKISLADNVIQRNSMNHVIPKRCLFAWFIVSIRIIRISVDIKLASVNSNKFVLSFINS